MAEHNAKNERIKRRYFAYMKEADSRSEATVNAAAMALARFEGDTRFRDFRAFHFEQAIAFKRRLATQRARRSGEKLSKATLHSTLAHLKRFFHWLAGQPGYRSRLQYTDANYFNLSENDVRIATARRDQTGPTVEQVKHALSQMPADSVIQLRDRALVAFTFLTGARDGAIASLKLKHIDLADRCVQQDAREVRTKFSKTFTTYFFPVGEEIERIVTEWVAFLREAMLWGNDDPLFPATRVVVGPSQRFEAVGLERAHWSTAAPIRAIFRAAFVSAGLPYFNPHSFRHTLARLGETLCKEAEEFKAWSQNIGHEKVLTTFTSYGRVERRRQAEIIRGLAAPPPVVPTDVTELAKALLREMRGSGLGPSPK